MVEVKSAWAAAVGAAIYAELGTRSQKWLADQTGIDPSIISKMVNGKQLPTLDQVDDIARALGTSRRWLLGRAGYVEPKGDIDLSLISEDNRAALLAAYEVSLYREREYRARENEQRTPDDVDSGL